MLIGKGANISRGLVRDQPRSRFPLSYTTSCLRSLNDDENEARALLIAQKYESKHQMTCLSKVTLAGFHPLATIFPATGFAPIASRAAKRDPVTQKQSLRINKIFHIHMIFYFMVGL